MDQPESPYGYLINFPVPQVPQPNPTLHLLPGMGADVRMFGPAISSLEGVKLFNWPRYRGERTLAEVAERVLETYGMQDGTIWGGASLGGMVACEIARILGQKQVVLIGSTTSRNGLSMLTKAALPFANHRLFQVLLSVCKRPMLSKYFLLDMFSASNAGFLTATCHDLRRWQGVSNLTEWRIHGDHDRIIRCSVKTQFVIKGGGHLITLSRDVEVANALKNLMAQSRKERPQTSTESKDA